MVLERAVKSEQKLKEKEHSKSKEEYGYKHGAKKSMIYLRNFKELSMARTKGLGVEEDKNGRNLQGANEEETCT